MADDERRAEIEAVAKVLKALPEPTMAAVEPYTVARAVVAALDRVRDARGGDEGRAEIEAVLDAIGAPECNCRSKAEAALARIRDCGCESAG